MHVGISGRKHIPVLKISNAPGHSFAFWQFSEARRAEKSNLLMDSTGVLTFEEMRKFGKYYEPPFSLLGKTVLDIGACCGETAQLFFRLGAAKVICVESNRERADLIRKNVDRLGWNCEVYAERFKPEHLNVKADFIKCDIEGYEMELLPHLDSRPCVVEVHNWWIKEQFEKAGFHAVNEPHPMLGLCIMVNY